jgi:hypothetical protein
MRNHVFGGVALAAIAMAHPVRAAEAPPRRTVHQRRAKSW